MKRLTLDEFNKAPKDVQAIHALAMLGMPVGSGLFERAVKEHPQYFPEEVAHRKKWNSIPQSVHDAYWKEISDFENKWMEENPGDPKWINGGVMMMIKHPECRDYFDRKFQASNDLRKKLDKKYYEPYLK